jgi:DNA polymerase kappa
MSSSSSAGKCGSDYAHLFVFSGANKAGMVDVDKAKQAQVIYESSKDSNYFKHAVAQDKKTDAKIRLMQDKLSTVSDEEARAAKLTIERETGRLESRRNFSRICCVLDMDMFFAACELRDRPELRDSP